MTTNLEFSKWGGIFTDDQMAATMIDYLVHHGHVLVFEGKSYRMEHALMRRDVWSVSAKNKQNILMKTGNFDAVSGESA